MKFKSGRFPLTAFSSSSSFFYFSVSMRCKVIGFQSMVLTFINNARVRQTPGASQLYLRYNVGYVWRDHYFIQIHISNENSIFTHYFMFMGEHIWERFRCELGTNLRMQGHAKPKKKFPIVPIDFRIMNMKALERRKQQQK